VSETVASPRPKHRRHWWYIRGTLKVMAFFFVLWFLILPLIPGFQKASQDLGNSNVWFIIVGFVCEGFALFCYSLLTQSALGATSPSPWRLFRIQLSTRAVSSLMPGGSAAGSALGYRLLTASGVPAADAGFALATVGLGSAVMLNFLLFVGLMVSIPLRGVNPVYGTAAVVGVVLLVFSAGVVVGLLQGQTRAERFVRFVARRLRFEPDRAVAVIRHVADRMRYLLRDRRLLARFAVFAALNWLLDAAALWMFIRAFGGSMSVDGLLVAFCLANVLAVIPITPGGLGIVEGVYIPTLTGFGITRSQASLGVIGYRLAQYWVPMLIGGLAYISLRVGPFSMEKRDRLARLREVAHDSVRDTTDSIEWAEKYAQRRPGT
jgi:uncharacterized protein (TIRG00374 family)